jgi:hypothetical protein
MGMMARFPGCPAMPGGPMLPMIGLGPHSQYVGCRAVRIAKRLRLLARRVLSRAWVSNGRFHFLCSINSKGRGAGPVTFLSQSSVSVMTELASMEKIMGALGANNLDKASMPGCLRRQCQVDTVVARAAVGATHCEGVEREGRCIV